MRKKELTKEQKEVLNEIKTTWKIKFPGCKIYCDKRKTFYRIKLYMMPLTVAKRAKKLAEKFAVSATVEGPVFAHRFARADLYNCVIRHYYV